MSQSLESRVLPVLRVQFSAFDLEGTFDVDDYVHAAGRSSEALLYASLYCPSFIELDDCVVLATAVATIASRAGFAESLARQGRQMTERAFNFIEIPYLFGPSGRTLDDDGDELLAEVLVRSWTGCLAAQFPGRAFTVETVPPHEAGGVVGIQFYQP